MNRKEDRVNFVAHVKQKLNDYDFVKVEDIGGRESFTFVGEKNTFTVSVPREDKQKQLYCLFGRFELHNKLTGSLSLKYNFNAFIASNFLSYLDECLDVCGDLVIPECDLK